MDPFLRLIISTLTVTLLGNIITSDHPVQLGEIVKVGHNVPKRETSSCLTIPCVTAGSEDSGVPFILSIALVSVLVLSGLLCMLRETCLRKGRHRSDLRQVSSSRSVVIATTPPKATSRASVNFDLDINDNDLYSTDGDDNSVLEGPEFSMMESYDMGPVAACSPYHLAWTTPKGRRLHSKSDITREHKPCTCTVINECVDHHQSSKPECDQNIKHRAITEPDCLSVSSSTPYRTPRVGYAHGRPCPTPIERLAAIRPGIASPAMKIYTPGPTEHAITPKKLFLEKRRRSVQTPVQRLLEIQPRVSQSDDTYGSRMEDSLLWDSYPFRPSEESLAWDDYMMDKQSMSKIDENCNDPTFSCLEEGMLQAPRSVAL